MEVYHASTMVVQHPDTQHSRDYLDFGKGFYLTTLREQAEKYATRFTRRGKTAILNTYELDVPNTYKSLNFPKYDEAWLDFVTECRAGHMGGDYDIIQGGIANDKVFRTVDLYFSGDISKQECLNRLIYEKPNNQICIRNQGILDKYLTFKSSEQL